MVVWAIAFSCGILEATSYPQPMPIPLPSVPVITDPDEIEQIELEIETEFSESLGAIDFADALPENLTPEQLDKVSISVIRYLLQSGEGGYKDGVDEIQSESGDPPSADNAWLWDAEAGEFRGRFVDRRPSGDRLFSFVVGKSGDSWARNFSPIGDEGVSDG